MFELEDIICILELARETSRQKRGNTDLQPLDVLLKKLSAEIKEFLESVTYLDSISEAADLVYYLIQIRYTLNSMGCGIIGEMLEDSIINLFNNAPHWMISVKHAKIATIAKYECRHKHGKNHDLEKEAIKKALNYTLE